MYKIMCKKNKLVSYILRGFFILNILSILSISNISIASYKHNKSPVGAWKTIDDISGKPKSIVEIKLNNKNQLVAKVKKILFLDKDTIKENPNATPDTVKCIKCTGKNKNKLIQGMTILWGVSKDNPDNKDITAEWSGGTILDPKSGSEYSVKLYLDESGNKLNVRGYMGFSLFGRTQVWHRI